MTYTNKHKHNTREVCARLHAGRCLSSLSHMYHTPHWLKVSWVCHAISIPSMMSVSLWVARFLLLPLPALHHLLPVLPLHALRQLWLHDNQPARLRQWDLRDLRRFLPTYNEPMLLDNFHYSETLEMIFQEESGDKETEPTYLCDARGTRRWNSRESAIFTTVPSGARRTSEPETSLSLTWRKLVVQSVVVCRSMLEQGDLLLSMTKIPHDDILEGLYKLRIRESEKLKTVLELYDLETHQKKLGPDYHRLKAMVKRSIEQEIRNKNFGARSGNFEKNAVVKNQGTKQREQRILGDCWQWKANRQCVKGDKCSLRHVINKRGKVAPSNPSPNSFMQQKRNASRTRCPRGKSPSGGMFRCPSRIPSKELAITHPAKDGILLNVCSTRARMVAVLGKSARMHIVRLKNSLAKGLKRMVTKLQWPCWRIHDNLVAYSRIWSRRSLHLFCRRAQTYGNLSVV